MRKIYIDLKEVKRLAEEGLSQQDIAHHFGVSRSAMHYRFAELGLVKRQEYPDLATITGMLLAGKSRREIAERTGWSRSYIQKLTNKKGPRPGIKPELAPLVAIGIESMPIRDLAKIFHVVPSTVLKFMRKHGIKNPRARK